MALSGGTLRLQLGATESPVAATGYTKDVIWTGSETSPAQGIGTTATFDLAGEVLYASGVPGSPGGGLPQSREFTSVASPAVTFQLQPYNANNAMQMSSSVTNGILTLAAPARYSAIGILDALGNSSTPPYTNGSFSMSLNFTTGASTVVSNITSFDWFDNSPYAISGLGRVSQTGIFNTSNALETNDPRLYEFDYALSAADQARTLSSIGFIYGGGTHTVNIMGISGSMLNGSATLANNVALASGTTSTIDVAATTGMPNYTLGSLTVAGPAPAILDLTAATAPPDLAYGLSLGAVTLSADVTFNVTNNGAGTGTLTLGAVAGSGFGITKQGPGLLLLPAGNSYTGMTVVQGGTVNVVGSLAVNGSSRVGIDPSPTAPTTFAADTPKLIRTVATGSNYAGLGSQFVGDLATTADILAGMNSGQFATGSAAATMSWRARATGEIGAAQGGSPNAAAGLDSLTACQRHFAVDRHEQRFVRSVAVGSLRAANDIRFGFALGRSGASRKWGHLPWMAESRWRRRDTVGKRDHRQFRKRRHLGGAGFPRLVRQFPGVGPRYDSRRLHRRLGSGHGHAFRMGRYRPQQPVRRGARTARHGFVDSRRGDDVWLVCDTPRSGRDPTSSSSGLNLVSVDCSAAGRRDPVDGWRPRDPAAAPKSRPIDKSASRPFLCPSFLSWS